MQNCEFALVIPCYHFENGIDQTFQKILKWRQSSALSELKEMQVVFVDDGSTDETVQRIKKIESENTWVRSIFLEKNKGKGAAVRAGFLFASKFAKFVIFTDCDLHYGLQIISDRVLNTLKNTDIVILDRSWAKEAAHQNIFRRMASATFKRIVSILVGVNFRDTQAGLKGFRVSSCLPVFQLSKLNGFSFDVELLSIALFYRLGVLQIPINYEKDFMFPRASSVRLMKDALKMIRDVFRVNLNWKLNAYDSAELTKRIDDQIYTLR